MVCKQSPLSTLLAVSISLTHREYLDWIYCNNCKIERTSYILLLWKSYIIMLDNTAPLWTFVWFPLCQKSQHTQKDIKSIKSASFFIFIV